MLFEGSPDEFLNYQHSLDSPDLRPIPLPMSGLEKSYDGMINLQNAAISFPGSNAFAQYDDYISRMPNQYAVAGPYQEAEAEYFSDSDYTYPVECDAKAVAPVSMSVPIAHTALTTNVNSQTMSRKRKASPSLEYLEPQSKKAAVAQVHVQDPEGEFYEINQPSPYSPYVVVPPTHTGNNSPRAGHHYSASNASQISLAEPLPHTPAWSPSFNSLRTEQSPRAPMTPIPRPASTATPHTGGMPKLVRTSTIHQQGSPGLGLSSNMNVGMHTQNFNPYSVYPQQKANLKLKGDLDAVAADWSSKELEARRKIVVFTRSQNGSTIEAEFKAVSLEGYSRGDIAVNCIWWKERKEAYVTSVDTISLLEQLVAVRFTVEEKNRIRRNLEGFRPLTVSKAKADSEEFFKVIMGFAAPKPRNIEKDVKVFPWKILSVALNKIISKYSASYSSTASLVTPAPSVYASTENSADYQLAPSPGYDMTAHVMPPCTVPATTFGPVTTAVPDLSLQVPSMPVAYEMMHGYGYDVMPTGPYLPVQQAMTAPVQRPPQTWNFEPFVTHEGIVQMQPASAPASAYPRQGETAQFMVPPAYRHEYH